MDSENIFVQYNIQAEAAKQILITGNLHYVEKRHTEIESTTDILLKTSKDGQKPYAIIVTCSDTRVIPEAIFSACIGDLYVIRVGGNVIDDHQLGSIEYAAEHLGTGLVVVLGHTNCDAVEKVLSGHTGGYVQYITDDIKTAIGEEKDPHEATRLNVEHSCKIIESSLQIQKDEKEYGLKVIGAIYDIETGKVEFI